MMMMSRVDCQRAPDLHRFEPSACRDYKVISGDTSIAEAPSGPVLSGAPRWPIGPNQSLEAQRPALDVAKRSGV